VRIFLAVIGAFALTTTVAFGGSITSIPYSTAYSEGLAYFFPVGTAPPMAGYTPTFQFTGVDITTNATPLYTEGCVGPGCPVTRPAGTIYTLGVDTTSASSTVNSGPDQEQYQGTSFAGAGSLDVGGSLNVTGGSGSASQSEYVSAYAETKTPLTVAATPIDPAGTAGTLSLSFTVAPPAVTGTAAGAATTVWFGEFTFLNYLPTGDVSTAGFEARGIDFSTLAAPETLTYSMPFIFGSPVEIQFGEWVGIGWSANASGSTSASASFDPPTLLSAIQVSDANGIVPDFSITNDVGDEFGPDGLLAPEPSSWLLMCAAALAATFAWVVRGRRLRQS
jgi:hypothetical protein